MNFKIGGKTWEVRFRRARRFARKWPGVLGVCDTHKKRLEFPLKKLHYETIAHEVCHAYMDELCLGNAVGLKRTQLEEAYCELFSKYGQQMLGLSRQILLEYQKARNA